MNHTNRVDVHPEDLLDAAYRGELDDAGRQRLNEHMMQCAACRLEHSLIDELAEETAVRDDDDARLHAAVTMAMGNARPPAASSTSTTAPSRAAWAPRRVAWVTGGALLVGAFAGAAAAWWAMAPAEPQLTVQPRAAVEEPAIGEGEAPEPRVVLPAPAVAEEPQNPPVEAVEAIEAVEAVEAPAPRQLSAAELLTRANQARRDGEARLAVRRYQELQSVYPGSREARLSHVSLARLYLDRLADPQAALNQLDRYLEEPGQLAEEARVGRALALARLGRTAEERRAWQDLLDHHPSSPHADRARARIEQP